MPPTPVVRVQPSYQHHSKVSITKVIPRKKDLITYKSPKEILFLMHLTDPRLSSNHEVLKLLKELRGGSWGLIGTATFLGLMILIFSVSESFVPNNPNPFSPYHYYGSGPSGSAVQITRPSSMPHQEFVGLTKEERRQVPHPYDKIIHVEGHPRLRIGFWQSRYKVPEHGALHGLPYSVKANGGTLNRLLARIYGSCDSFSPDPEVEIAMADEPELKDCAQILLLKLQE